MEINTLVGRKSYQCDLLFRVIAMNQVNGQQIATLFGEDFRLVADAPIEDLIVISEEERTKKMSEVRSLEEQSLKLFRQDVDLLRLTQEYKATSSYKREPNYFQIPGRVLHLDGDPSYLEKCLDLYKTLGVTVYGIHCNEKEMYLHVGSLIEHYRPDILVITGHDAYSKAKGKKMDLHAYRHSKYFVETVKEARKKVPQLDQLVIFAGACQSHFESLIYAGANFASSPHRVNIHALDPVYIVSKISFTPFMERINVWDVLRNTLTGERGLGGIDTKGVLRMGMPFKPAEIDE
ncbi:sporulation peptidase YabG [Bacillus sp. FJAT-50079]|uniref:sporulation peptidase YabG n=1 Tax=Bacillus sp. FJAT-50079 TaxID=2833577 RepID=UPI001BC900D3|nr:sporulation peptidase YabG [Bacillus sp. FJAT-50079]MBS4210794.1 sporulation peptidase YabG [Bacillus sp. FJAT-50079]